MFSYPAGIDVSKDSLEARVHQVDVGVNCANAEEDFPGLIGWLLLHQVGRVLLEATGGYERKVMKALQAAGLNVICINPRRAKSFSTAMGQQAKTDPIDAKSLAQFAAVLDSPNSRITSPKHDELRALVQQRENFIQQRDDDKRRLKTASCDVVKPALQSHMSCGVEGHDFFFPLSFNLIDCGGISGHHPSSQSDIKETMESIHYVFAETQVLSRHILRKKAVQKL